MYFGLHTTKKQQRDALRQTEFDLIEIDPRCFHANSDHKPVVWEEDTGEYYEHDISPFVETLKMIEKGKFNYVNSPYYGRWAYKGTEVETRLQNLPLLFNDIKANGIKEPVACEQTGERIDGSFRTKIAIYLKIPRVRARLYKFNWRDIDEDFIERKLKARNLSSGKDYYQFEYGYKGWKNVELGGNIYEENAKDRWEVLKDLVKGKKILDVGCNEGFMSLQLALQGKTVTGIDHDWIHIANLNRLVYEFVNKKDLKAKFIQDNVLDQELGGYDEVLLLNVLYHLPEQEKILRQLKGSRVIFQCNLRKERERKNYYTSHPDDLKELLTRCGYKVEKEIAWRDKPIIIAKYE